MKVKKSKVGSGNGDSYGICYMPLQNALGIDNWPQHVQDECRRVNEKDFDREFISGEEMLIAGLDGRPVLNSYDVIRQGVFDPYNVALWSAINGETDQDEAARYDNNYLVEQLAAKNVKKEEASEITAEEFFTYKEDKPISFHGTSRVEVVPGTKRYRRMKVRAWRVSNGRRAHFNTKREKISRHEVTARLVDFEMQVAEENIIARLAFREERFAFARAAF